MLSIYINHHIYIDICLLISHVTCHDNYAYEISQVYIYRIAIITISFPFCTLNSPYLIFPLPWPSGITPLVSYTGYGVHLRFPILPDLR
jgi:hypothetical protein